MSSTSNPNEILSTHGNQRRETMRPAWDWFMLPALGILTVCALLMSLKMIGKHVSSPQGSLTNCMIVSDPSTGWRGIPNSACPFKGTEHQLVKYTFNRCGDYSTLECDKKEPGVYRIVLVGSSYAFGWGVQRDQSFAAILPAQLSQIAGRPVELYNQSMVASSTGATARRADEALAAKPDLILWAVSPADIQYNSFVHGAQPQDPDRVAASPLARAEAEVDTIRQRWNRTSIGILLQHYLFQSRTLYVKLYLMSGDNAGFLDSNLSPEWQDRLRAFDRDVAEVETSARASDVPVVVTLLPDRILSTVVAMEDRPSGMDPYELDHALRSIVVRHGGIYVDILPGFRTLREPQKYYMPVDDHPYPSGHRLISGLLANELTTAVPALNPAMQTRPNGEDRR